MRRQGSIVRIVRDQLIYVSDGSQVRPFRPSQFVITSPSGAVRRYRGESFDELKLTANTQVSLLTGANSQEDKVEVALR